MKRFLFLTLVLCCLTGMLSFNAVGQILLNELDVDPNGADDGCEYVELIGPAGASTTHHYFVSLEGDSNKGQATLVIQFGDSNNPGPNLGSNGLLVVRSAVGCGSRNYGAGTGTTIVSTPGLDSGVLQNGSNSFLLIFSPNAPITTGTTPTDYDTNDDGVLELPSGAVIVDGIAWADTGTGDIIYGSARATATGATATNTLDAVTRFPGNRYPNATGAWYGGIRTGAPGDLNYGTNIRTPNLPPDGVLTPGTPNVGTRDAAVDQSFDGKTDFVILRQGAASDTAGATQLSWWTYAGNGSILPTLNWGQSGDIAVPGDFDGDGRDDHAVYRPSNATFYIFNSSNSAMRVEQFGQTGDDPTVSADYTGDGIDDLAVYRQGTWFYRTESFFNTVNWGQAGDTPAPGDYTGDGKADFAIRRPNGQNGDFWIFADGGINIVTHGGPADRVVPGDYDGDGKTDIATVATVNGTIQWIWRPSATPNTFLSEIWGIAGQDLIGQGDYDGDGRTDLAIYRPTDGKFWIFSEPTRLFIVQAWGGQAGDTPVAGYNAH